MRLMLRFTIPVEKGNESNADGSQAEAIKNLVAQLKPEACYFHLHEGKRAGTIIYHETEAARMAVTNEPFFAAVNAAIDIQPVAVLDELLARI